MPTNLPVATVVAGTIYTPTLYNNYLAANINKLLNTGHRVLTVAQFNALTGLEGTKGTVAPDEVYLEVDSTNGIQWHLAYESGETTYKWRFLGGPAMQASVVTAEATSSATDVDLATVGPSLTLPRGGDYDMGFSFQVTGSNSGNAAGNLYAGAGLIAGLVTNQTAVAGAAFSPCRVFRAVARAASDVMKLKYSNSTATAATFSLRTLAITPVRIV